MTNVAILAAGAVAATVVGGLGWKSLKNRKTKTPVVEKPAKLSAEEQAMRKLEIRARMLGHYTMPTKAPVAEAVAKVVETPIVEPVAAAELQDVVKFDPEADMVSVSRMRVVETKPKATTSPASTVVETPEHQNDRLNDLLLMSEGWDINDNAPMFWKAFCRNIRRMEVVHVTENMFEDRPKELARGYHRATFCATPGVLHVTKGNITFVSHCKGDNAQSLSEEFLGYSSTASRFGGKGIQNITAKQAKDFLNGR
jgi:hypothetical protein